MSDLITSPMFAGITSPMFAGLPGNVYYTASSPATLEDAERSTDQHPKITGGAPRMSEADLRESIDAITRYFETTAATRSDPLHIRSSDIRRALGAIDPAGRRLLELMQRDVNVYLAFKAMQNEGFQPDPALTMRDLYAARRGTGYNGESLEAQINQMRLVVRTKP